MCENIEKIIYVVGTFFAAKISCSHKTRVMNRRPNLEGLILPFSAGITPVHIQLHCNNSIARKRWHNARESCTKKGSVQKNYPIHGNNTPGMMAGSPVDRTTLFETTYYNSIVASQKRCVRSQTTGVYNY